MSKEPLKLKIKEKKMKKIEYKKYILYTYLYSNLSKMTKTCLGEVKGEKNTLPIGE